MTDEFTDFPCDVCNSNDAIEVPRIREYTNGQVVHICKNCGLVYVKKRRSYQKIADNWSDSLFGDTKVLRPDSYSARNPHVKSRMVYFAEFIDTHIGLKDKKVCDIGAGEGQFFELIQPAGAEVFGVEPSKKNCSLLKNSGFECFEGPIEAYHGHWKSSGKKYSPDIITMSFTLECTQQPAETLRLAHEILKDGGHIAIHMGSRILVPFKKPMYNFWSGIPMDAHPVQFSFNTLKGILSMNGFEVTHANPYVENDNLCVIAKKCPSGHKVSWEADQYLQVEDFFERWHKESLYYKKSSVLSNQK